MAERPLVELDAVSKTYRVGDRPVPALVDVSLAAMRGETLAVVGESGSGKSTLGRIVLGIEGPDRGMVRLSDRPLTRPLARAVRRRLQVVQQNPLSALNPRRKIGRSVALPLTVHRLASRREVRRRVTELLDLVGLPADSIDRYPSALSGGQRQRAALARALAAEPDLLVLDEPTSSLDVSVQARVLHLLVELQARFNLTYVFITHDLAVVRNIAGRVAVLYRGRLVETGPTLAVFAAPQHRYTAMLLSAIPVISEAEERLKPPWPVTASAGASDQLSAGCPFAPRCPFSVEACWRVMPALDSTDGRHFAACHNPGSAPA